MYVRMHARMHVCALVGVSIIMKCLQLRHFCSRACSGGIAAIVFETSPDDDDESVAASDNTALSKSENAPKNKLAGFGTAHLSRARFLGLGYGFCSAQVYGTAPSSPYVSARKPACVWYSACMCWVVSLPRCTLPYEHRC